ncbi:hypothetical protein BSLG_006869 [Batrachochytrium salamandrivorans]|nr:hypothetical protein BSLG_006869 [Batrachochytrium salamandrivorans]
MGPTIGYSIDQLMELAGLSVAQAIFREYSPQTHRRVLVCAGPVQLFGIPFVDSADAALPLASLIVDGIFGFSFSGDIRPPLTLFSAFLKRQRYPLNISNLGLDPEMLVSLTAPKLGVVDGTFKYHYLGGRFVPAQLILKYQLDIPKFLCTDQVVDISCRDPQ